MTTEVNERDIVATDEMIRNLNAGTFKKIAIGAGVCGALLLAGCSLLVWTYRHGNDPEVLKEALRHMSPLNVTVTFDPESRVVRLAEGGTVTLANPPVFPSIINGGGGGSHDPAISTSVTVFKSIKYGDGDIYTGWDFANGAAKTPTSQYCYYRHTLGDGNSVIQSIGGDGNMVPPPTGVKDQSQRFAKCQWFSGDIG